MYAEQMAEFTLYCFGESGNSYKPALMLQCAGLDWQPKFVDYFNGETRTPAYREMINEMGEAPVLIHGDRKISQSGVILDYLAGVAGKFGPLNADERREILRWMLFDNHKLTGSIASLRFLISIAKTGETATTDWLRKRALAALSVVDGHLANNSFMIGPRPTIADFSLVGYLYYGEELPFDLSQFKNVGKWLVAISKLEGWKLPYDLMPRKRQ
jgi:glutathione S-transferase